MFKLEKGHSSSKYNQMLDEIHLLSYANTWEWSHIHILFLSVHAIR